MRGCGCVPLSCVGSAWSIRKRHEGTWSVLSRTSRPYVWRGVRRLPYPWSRRASGRLRVSRRLNPPTCCGRCGRHRCYLCRSRRRVPRWKSPWSRTLWTKRTQHILFLERNEDNIFYAVNETNTIYLCSFRSKNSLCSFRSKHKIFCVRFV